MTKGKKAKAAALELQGQESVSPVAQHPKAARKQTRKNAHKLVLRTLRVSDYPDIQEIMDTVYPQLMIRSMAGGRSRRKVTAPE